MSGFGITGIGNSPYSTALGLYGLGDAGAYGSYGDPTMMGMSPYAMGGIGSMGMMGMYPSFMAQMNQIQQNMEKNQLTHAGAMHQLMLQNKTQAYADTNQELFKTMMVDGDINDGIDNLYKAVVSGNSNAICEKYDVLKNNILKKYSNYFTNNIDNMNLKANVNNYIGSLYSKIMSAKLQEQVDLREDLQKYGETAFEHGFFKHRHGRTYHNKRTENAMQYIYDMPIDNIEGKARMEKAGAAVEGVIEVPIATVAGSLAGAGIGATALGLGKLLTLPLPESMNLSFTKRVGSWCKKGAWLGAIAALVGDIAWQYSRN